MSSHQYPSLQTLPVEILHRICEYVDVQTILLSLRNTCRRIRAVVKNYDRYILDFRLFSRPSVRIVCHLIDPRQVRSLTLCHKAGSFDQIVLFNSMFRVKKFTRVRSLTLIAIKESQLRDILKRVNISSLISLSLDIRQSNDRPQSMTTTLLTSIFSRSNLYKLVLNIPADRIENINWPNKYTIEYLEIGVCIHFDQISTILHGMPRLRTLIIASISVQNIRQTDLVPFQQVTTLVFKQLSMRIDNLELLLRLMPSLTHLKLIGNGNLLNGYRWEQFIQGNLPLLNKFEFIFNEDRADQSNSTDIEWIIASFRTEFWIKMKKWFVTCEYNINMPEQIKLYSIPICEPSLNSKAESTKMSISTLPTTVDGHASIMVNIDMIGFNFTKLTSKDIEQKREIANHPLFRTIKKLGIQFNSNCPVGWIPFVSVFIDLTIITHIGLIGEVILKANPAIVTDIASLLHQACNVSTLIICGRLSTHKYCLTADDICTMIPVHVRYLTVAIKSLNEVKIVLERIEHLSSAKFLFDDTPCWTQFHEWFKTKKQRLSYRTEPFSVHVWFETNSVQTHEVSVSNKRIKLTDDHHDP